MNIQELYIPCDGMKVHAKLSFPAEKREKYPLLVIIPGLTGHIEETHILSFARVANECGYAALRAELYGHGGSEGRFYDHTVLHWMVQAMRVIDYAKNLDFVSDILLGGHSQGGLTSVLAGGMMSDCIKALIPLSPAMIIRDAARDGEILGAPFDPEHLPTDINLHDDFTFSANYIRAAKVLPVEQCIQAFGDKPVLVVHGTTDESVPFCYGENLAKAYPNATLVPIEQDTHCYNHHLDEMEAAVRAFLKELS